MGYNLFQVNGIALKAYMGIRSVMGTPKTKFLFFCCLNFTSSDFPYQYQNYSLKILKYIDIDIYTDIV